MTKRKKPEDLVEEIVRMSVRAAAALRKQGVLMHTAITFGPLPKQSAKGKKEPQP